jgi:hypothetical protein
MSSKQKILTELRLMAKIRNEFVVQYDNSWIENNNTLFIQMKLCFDTLREI